jgi:hypothetical protein
MNPSTLDQRSTLGAGRTGPSSSLHNPGTRRDSRLAGLVYGLIYCLTYGLTVWGIDARGLFRASAELAGAKLAAGLPLLLLVGAAAGALAGRSARAGTWVGVWIAGGALMGALVGAMPSAGLNLATWMVEPRLRGIDIYPMGAAGTARMAFTAAFMGCVGSAIGLAGHVLVERARGARPAAGRMSGRAWATLALILPLAALPALVVDEVVNRPLRAGQQVVHRSISTSPMGGSEEGETAAYRDLFAAAGYRLHRVSTDPETVDQQVIDAAFDNGVVVRCGVSDQVLTGCLPIAPEFAGWMEALVRTGLGEGSEAELASLAGQLYVDDDALSWLASQGEMMSKPYQVSRDTQRGGWVVMSARFDSGYVLTCDFYGDAPVVLQGCNFAQPL